jgi:GT2 family glycosyltransferase
MQDLVLKTGDIPAGWILVEGHLGRRGRHLLSSLRVLRQAGAGPDVEIPLPVFLDGRIHELIELPGKVGRLVWRPPEIGKYEPSQLSVRPIGWLGRTARMVIRVVRAYLRLSEDERRDCGLELPQALRDLEGAYRTCTGLMVRSRQSYPEWIEHVDALTENDMSLIRAHIDRFTARPRFHILVKTHGGGLAAVAATLASLRAQLYQDYECTVLDVAGVLGERSHAGSEEARVPVVAQEAVAAWLTDFNASLAGSRAADWVMLAHAGDRLPAHSLYWFAREALARAGAAVLYSDDDTMDAAGRRLKPRFKPDWSLAHLHSCHYVGAAAFFLGAAVAAAGGIRRSCCRHGNYGLLLRTLDASRGAIEHVPAMLYHRGEATDAAWENPGWCSDALQLHLARNDVAADIHPAPHGTRRLRYRLPDPPPLISIIVPTRDAAQLLKQCIDSVLAKSTYPRFEILVVDNRTTEPAALAYLARIAQHPAVRVLRHDRRFNYSAINNHAAREARGDALCLLNNDTEVITPDWLEEMMGHLSQPRVGAVGAKLYYPDGRVQHAGVTVGPGGCANHLHLEADHDTGGYCGRAMIAHELSAVTGACLLTWKHLYEGLGGLNAAQLAVAFNDVDYCLRLQEAGYRVVFTPHAELYHHESATRGTDEPLQKRLRARSEIQYMRRRWRERMRHDPYYNPNLSYRRFDFALGETTRVRKPWLT